MDKSAFVGAVESGTICQGTQEKSHPPVHWVLGRQTSVLTVDSAVACDAAPCSSRLQSRSLWKHWQESLCGSLSFQRRSFSTILEQKRIKEMTSLDALAWVRIAWLYLHHSFPGAHGSGPREMILVCDFSYREKGECVRQHLLPQLCRNCHRGSFLYGPMRTVESWAKRLGNGRGLGDGQAGPSEGIKGKQILLTTSQPHQEACPCAAESAPPADPLQLAQGHHALFTHVMQSSVRFTEKWAWSTKNSYKHTLYSIQFLL